MLQNIIDSKSKTFIAFCFCFLAGIAAASIVNKKFDFAYFYFFFVFLAGFMVVFWRDRKPRFVFICLVIFLAAFVRYNFALPDNNKKYVSYYNGNHFSFSGTVAVEPDIRIDSVSYIIQPDNFKGRVYFKSALYPRYEYGDRLQIECDLRAPEKIDNFRYDMYLARFGVFSVCFKPEINITGSGEGNMVLEKILEFKQVFAGRINKLWHEPYAGFVAGLLYGYRGGLGNLQETFNRTGITHIIAISGYNISLIAGILATIFVYLWIPRKRAFWLVSFGIFLFVIFTGASGSVVRAGIMGFLVLLARRLGRLNRINNALALTAALMAAVNPFVLFWDAGFQLSFLATVGIIYFSPVLQKKLYRLPGFFGLRENFASTMSAIIATMPLILYQFGRLSIIAPLVNLLILWIIPIVMLFGFMSVFFSFVYYPLGQILSWFTWVMLKYITATAGWFSDLSFASVDFAIPLWLLFLLYFILFFYFYRNRRGI